MASSSGQDAEQKSNFIGRPEEGESSRCSKVEKGTFKGLCFFRMSGK